MKKRILSITAILFVILLVAGCGRSSHLATTPETHGQTDPLEAEPVPQPSGSETRPSDETAAPSETAPTDAESPAEPPVLHSGIREDGSFDEGTLFIGDSQTYLFIQDYLKPNGLLGDAKYTAQCGSQLTAFWDDDIRPTEDRSVYCVFSPEFEGLSFREAATQFGAKATSIYLMWGSNHTPDATAQSYIDIVQYLLDVCPNATVHLETIPQGDVAYVTVNGRIQGAWEYFQQIGEPRVTLVDTFGGIGTSVGSDRVHVTPLGREKWYDTLVLHAQELGLSQ
jgi:hypothetical protein